ncbi:MAG: class I adenylate-forming enzyme family protein [Methylosarcina sp.]
MIYEYFKLLARKYPEKPAIISGKQIVSYVELLDRIDSLSVGLAESGLKEGDAVAVLLPNSVEFITSILAILARNAIAVPINTRFQAAEVQYYLETSFACKVIHGNQSEELLESISSPIARLNLNKQSPVFANGVAVEDVSSDSKKLPAIYMYSSGSTGKPKRVTRTQGQLIAEYQALSATIELSDKDVILCTVPLYHAHGFCNCMLASLLSGGTLVLMEGDFNPRESVKLIEGQGITVYPAVPFMIKMIAEAFYPSKPDLSNVRLFFTAGAPLAKEISERFRYAFGKTVKQLYGSTETGAICINYDGDAANEESVGKPLKGLSVDILDENGDRLPVGAVGEVAIRSVAMTLQYDDLPTLTAECFRDGYYLSGDLGQIDSDGRLFIKGRKKLFINVAGNKVDPLDVEMFIKTHPKVRDVVVVGMPHPNYGEMVKAVVVADDGCTEEEIVALCEKQFAWYKVPKSVEFRSEIPRSPLGKILRKYLVDNTGEAV